MRDAFESKALKALWLEEREHVRKSIAKQQVGLSAEYHCAERDATLLLSRADWVWSRNPVVQTLLFAFDGKSCCTERA